MIKIFGYIIIKATELPKKLTVSDLELLLAGKRHLQKYPVKQKVIYTVGGKKGFEGIIDVTYPPAGE